MVGDKIIESPKVLIISSFGLDSDAATDITLRSYFNHWPKNKLMILTFSPVTNHFANTITLKSDLFHKLRKFLSKYFIGKAVNNRNLIPGTILTNDDNQLNLKQSIFSIGAAYRDLFNIRMSKSILSKIDNFAPDLIYTILGNRRIIRLADKMSNRYGINVLPHFMDDWITTFYTGNIFLSIPRKLLVISFTQLMNNVKNGICISKYMCDEYEKRYNKKFVPLMNIVNFNFFDANSSPLLQRKRYIAFSYFGGLHLNRWKTLITLSKVLADLSKTNQSDLKLEIYTSENAKIKYSSKFLFNNVHFFTGVDHAKACNKMKETDYLIHVESFDKSVIPFTRLSISTKIPEYLASGTPICAIGPKNIASIKYLLENECGYMAIRNNSADILLTMQLAINGNENSIFKKNNIQLVKNNHSDKKITQFKKLLLLTSKL